MKFASKPIYGCRKADTILNLRMNGLPATVVVLMPVFIVFENVVYPLAFAEYFSFTHIAISEP